MTREELIESLADKMRALTYLSLHDQAKHILSAIEASGHVVVPVEPTQAMLFAAGDNFEAQYEANPKWYDARDAIEDLEAEPVWRSMLAANPLKP